MFIMLDGIDGSGKSTIIETWKDYLASEGNTIFDLKNYWLKKGAYPTSAELKTCDFIFSGEPTYAGVGKVIREELIKKGTNYSPRSIAEAYALDRLVLYRKIILPALALGKCIIQDRGVSTSLAYQPMNDPSLTPKILSSLEGNALALKYRPDHLVLLRVNPESAFKRIMARTHKQDNVIFERLNFQKKLAKLFASRGYAQLFKKHGSQVHYLPANDKLAIIKSQAIVLLKKILI